MDNYIFLQLSVIIFCLLKLVDASADEPVLEYSLTFFSPCGKNKAAPNTTHSITVSSEIQCARQCMDTLSCNGFNFNSALKTCELTDYFFSGKKVCHILQDKDGVEYYNLVRPCRLPIKPKDQCKADLRFENDTGTVLLLQFTDEVPHDVVLGDAILDTSGYRNHGVMQAAASFVSSNTLSVGLLLKNGGIRIPTSPSLQIRHSITIEIWMKANNLSCGYALLKPSSYGFPKLHQNYDMLAVYVKKSSQLAQSYIQSDYQLHYHVMTTSSEVTKVYLDGRMVQEYSTPGEIRSTTYALEIGQGIGWSGACDKVDGIIYSVRISKLIRTKDEIWTNYLKLYQ